MASAIRRVVEGAPTGPAESALSAALSPLGWAYGAAMRARGAAYLLGLLKSRRAPVPVICIGNLTLGGSGKTPVAAEVVRILIELGARPAIVSRGYGVRIESGVAIVSRGDGAPSPLTAREAGDEPLLLSRLLPHTPVVISPDRHRGATVAHEQCGATVVVLDDGFQHLRLKRDFDLVLVDSTRDPRRLRLFPAGPLREGMGALARATAIAITRVESGAHADVWREAIRAANPTAPIYQVSTRATQLVDAPSPSRADRSNAEPANLAPGAAASQPIETLAGQSVFAFSALANPAAFHDSLQRAGANIAGSRTFPDHWHYTPSDLAALGAAARETRARWLITTDKDAVKIESPDTLALPLKILRIEADFGLDRALLKSELEKVVGGPPLSKTTGK